MNGMLLIIMFALLVAMLLKNIRQAKSLKKDKTYVDCYMKILKGEEGASEELKKYIETENDLELKNRAKIVEIYDELKNDNDPKDLISTISLDNALFDNGKVNIEKLKVNSDTFIWLNMDLALSYAKNNLKLMKPLYDELYAHDSELKTVVEYCLFKAIYDYLDTKDEETLEFPKKLLGGEYAGMNYDKQLIAVNKKTAAAILAYGKQPLDDGYKDFLKDFASTQVGNKFMSDLGIIDEYLVKDEENKEEVEEEKE